MKNKRKSSAELCDSILHGKKRAKSQPVKLQLSPTKSSPTRASPTRPGHLHAQTHLQTLSALEKMKLDVPSLPEYCDSYLKADGKCSGCQLLHRIPPSWTREQIRVHSLGLALLEAFCNGYEALDERTFFFSNT
ncbi:hypothetical protein HDU91_007530 [Kappamyces sp. JEL0680]|nr:hypothetical protein HDU91_007530 [Kappamyces sp. JEL0680]